MKNNIKKSRFWEMLKQGLKSFFTKNIAIKVLSLMFAILLWGYVLMTQNPPRVKTVTDVTVSIEGEADLTTRKLTLRGDRAALLEDVSVRVRTAGAFMRRQRRSSGAVRRCRRCGRTKAGKR